MIRFNGITKKFVTIKLVESMIDHLNIESTILHRNSEEAKKQLELEAGSNIFLLLENNLSCTHATLIKSIIYDFHLMLPSIRSKTKKK